MESTMNLYITFYSVYTLFRSCLDIGNGFSFGVEKEKDDVFLFFSSNTTTEKINDEIQKYNPDKIFCSLWYSRQLRLITSILNKKWVLGGPLTQRAFFPKIINSNGATIHTGLIETYFGKEMSGKFSPYFSEFIKSNYVPEGTPISYSVSIGFGCYWEKCRFCIRKDLVDRGLKEKIVYRPNTEAILDSLPEFENLQVVAHTSLDALPPDILEKVLSAKRTVIFRSFLRAEKKILEVIKKYDDLSNQRFSIGFEWFSQGIVDILNKGIKLTTALELVEEIVEKGGRVNVLMMENYPFHTKESVKESINNLSKLSKLRKKIESISIFSFGPTWWPAEERSNFDWKVLRSSLDGRFIFDISKDSEQYRYEQEVLEYIKKENIPYRCVGESKENVENDLCTPVSS
jgi:hypothetical protein